MWSDLTALSALKLRLNELRLSYLRVLGNHRRGQQPQAAKELRRELANVEKYVAILAQEARPAQMSFLLLPVIRPGKQDGEENGEYCLFV
ncbi:hypothetical protein GYA54_03325 [Candidatus Kuenenbacteria bacterium]|nr:hypothetical protein [Candidatus Kuenenbacteria bacterium]